MIRYPFISCLSQKLPATTCNLYQQQMATTMQLGYAALRELQARNQEPEYEEYEEHEEHEEYEEILGGPRHVTFAPESNQTRSILRGNYPVSRTPQRGTNNDRAPRTSQRGINNGRAPRTSQRGLNNAEVLERLDTISDQLVALGRQVVDRDRAMISIAQGVTQLASCNQWQHNQLQANQWQGNQPQANQWQRNQPQRNQWQDNQGSMMPPNISRGESNFLALLDAEGF